MFSKTPSAGEKADNMFLALSSLPTLQLSQHSLGNKLRIFDSALLSSCPLICHVLWRPRWTYHFPLGTPCPCLAWQESCELIHSPVHQWAGWRTQLRFFSALLSHHPAYNARHKWAWFPILRCSAWSPRSQFCNTRIHYYGLFCFVAIFVYNPVNFCLKKNISKAFFWFIYF